MNEWQKGTLVQWKVPKDADEEREVMVVVEDRDTRLLVASVSHIGKFSILPTTAVSKDEVRIVEKE